ncbi:hypothetical protein [Massilia scottii]|uniref:hypothetical protein n=1 Tax=Massilia scottii TaxID=3057166 RepID=UPI0027966A92|nr:hypothetical protein [Massilia sp. CCM 9029]MDQ1831966.1 hypothetical protein [Massilia sp. CCM 9029]
MPAESASAAAKPWNDIAARPSDTTVATLVPGDTLVITCERALTRDQVEKIKSRVLRDLPPGCKVAVVHSGMTVAAVVQARRKPVIPQPQ